MSAPQLTDANSSSQWLRAVADPATGQPRSPSQSAIEVTQRRNRFVRLVTYTMVGLVAFTLLGAASFAWRQHSMKAALEAPVQPAPAVIAAAPAAPAARPASETNTETVPAPPAPAATIPRTVAKKVAKPPARTSPFLGAKKRPIRTR